MTHEVTVHRADATLAAGLPYEVAPEVAADAVDEWLEIVEWAQRTLPDDEVHGLRGPLRTIHLHATDTAPELHAEWVLDLTGDVITWRRAHEKSAVAVRGPITELLLLIYRRRSPDGLDVLGDAELLSFWLERVAFG
jgi:hypothetical protein